MFLWCSGTDSFRASFMLAAASSEGDRVCAEECSDALVRGLPSEAVSVQVPAAGSRSARLGPAPTDDGTSDNGKKIFSLTVFTL